MKGYIISGRPVMSSSGYYIENISSFLDHHLQPLAQAVKILNTLTTLILKTLTNS